MKNFDKYAGLTGKRLTGEISPEEERELSHWLEADGENQSFSSDLEEIWELSASAAPGPFETDMGQAWAKIEAALGGEENMTGKPTAKIVPMRKRLGRWSLAAAILALLALGLWWMNQGAVVGPAAFVEVKTGDGERKEIVLPDGSEITLNENSVLNYPEDFAERNVSLSGEAFFNVERMEDSPFTILSGNAATTVLGTSFNVRAYPQEKNVEVTVKTGKVALAVAEKKSEAIILEAGTSGVLKKAEATVEKTETKNANADAWKTMRLEFDDVMMRDVVSTLERYFGAKIEVSNEMIFECPYTSEFDQPDLDGILNVIGATLGFEVEKTGGGYRLKGPGCTPEN